MSFQDQASHPRLKEEVEVRIHWVAGEAQVWLFVPGQGRIVVGLREWRVLAVCDGTRDLDGLVHAASVKGTRTTRAYAESFMAQLGAAGLLEDGPPSPPAEGGRLPAQPVRSVRALPGYTLDCDGRGSCCRFFGTTTFTPVERLRARAIAPEVLDGAVAPERVFAPRGGSATVPWDGSAVAMVDGRCAFLEDDARCGLHRRAGPAAKPAGCRAFPSALVGTADAVHVTPRPECACVLRSARGEGGEPLVDAAESDGLPPELAIRELGDVALSPGGGDYRAWYAALALDEVEDVPAWLESEAARLLGDDAVEGAERRWREAAQLAHEQEGWRAADDLVRRVPELLLEATEEPAPDPVGERFYLRAIAFGHLWAFDGVTVGESLRLRAAALRLARRWPCAGRGEDPALDEPIALVEAFGRRAGVLAAS